MSLKEIQSWFHIKGLFGHIWRMLNALFIIFKFNCQLVKTSRKLKKSVREIVELTCMPGEVTRTLEGLPQPFKRLLYDKKNGAYFLRVPLHDGDTGPFCLVCADKESAAIHLLEWPNSVDKSENIDFYCKKCNHFVSFPVSAKQPSSKSESTNPFKHFL